MKLLAVIALFSIVVYSYAEVIYDGPIEGGSDKTINLEDVDTDAGLSTSTELPPVRNRRLVCDVLSAGGKYGSPSKIACPAKCFLQQRKNGSCVNGVCVCK